MATVDFTKDDLFYLLGRKTAEVETLRVLLDQARNQIVALTPPAEEAPEPAPKAKAAKE